MPRQIASTYRGDDGEAVNFICIITIKIENTSPPQVTKSASGLLLEKK